MRLFVVLLILFNIFPIWRIGAITCLPSLDFFKINNCDSIDPFPWLWSEENDFIRGQAIFIPGRTSTQSQINANSTNRDLEGEINLNFDNLILADKYLEFGPSSDNNNKGLTYNTSENQLEFLDIFKIKTDKIEFEKDISISGATNVALSSNAFFSLSDPGKKKNLKQISSEDLEKFNNLREVSFIWKSSGEKDFGFIAQEIEEVFPELINVNHQGIKFLNYDALIAFLIENLKNQNSQIQDRQKILDEIKNLIKIYEK